MCLVSKKEKFNCKFNLFSRDEVVYLSFISDSEKDENFIRNSAVLMPIFNKSAFINNERILEEPFSFSICLSTDDKDKEQLTAHINLVNNHTSKQTLIYTIKCTRDISVDWSNVTLKDDIINSFNLALESFLSCNRVGSSAIYQIETNEKSSTKKLSNLKFGCILFMICLLFYIIFSKINSPSIENSAENGNVILPEKTPVVSQAPRPPIVTVDAPRSVTGQSLNEYLQAAPSTADVNKSLSTSFQDADSVKQQVDLNKQVLKNLGLPQGSDNDTGCFTGG